MITTDLEHTLAPLDEGVYRSAERHFDEARELLVFSSEAIAALEEKKMKTSDMTDLNVFVIYSFFRMTSLGVSTWLLASGGHASEARALLRTMVEVYMKLRYVLLSPDANEAANRSTEFLLHGNQEFRELLEKAVDYWREAGDHKIVQVWTDALGRVPKSDNAEKAKSLWPAMKRLKLAEKAKCAELYWSVFSLFSADVHYSAEKLGNYYDEQAGAWGFAPITEGLDGVLTLMYELYVGALEGLGIVLGHPFKRLNRFRDILKEFKRLALG